MKAHRWLYWLSFGMTVTIACFLFCFNTLVRKVPWNLILVVVFTIFVSYLLASICIFQPIDSILIAAALTFAMFSGLTLFAFCVCLIFSI